MNFGQHFGWNWWKYDLIWFSWDIWSYFEQCLIRLHFEQYSTGVCLVDMNQNMTKETISRHLIWKKTFNDFKTDFKIFAETDQNMTWNNCPFGRNESGWTWHGVILIAIIVIQQIFWYFVFGFKYPFFQILGWLWYHHRAFHNCYSLRHLRTFYSTQINCGENIFSRIINPYTPAPHHVI